MTRIIEDAFPSAVIARRMMQAYVENNPEQVSEMDDTLDERLNRKVAVNPAQKRTSNVIPKKSLNRGKSISRYKR